MEPGLPQKVAFYVDGYNLYCGVRDETGRKYLWLDIHALCSEILTPNQEISTIHYCTASVRGNQDKWRRQHDYWAAIRTFPHLTIHEGYHQKNHRHCKCGQRISRYEEKQTDSRIAALMVADAMAGRADVLVLIGGDSDHIPPVETVRAECPGVSVLLFLPPKRKPKALIRVAPDPLHINSAMLKRCQLPEVVSTGVGQAVTRPAKWSDSTPR